MNYNNPTSTAQTFQQIRVHVCLLVFIVCVCEKERKRVHMCVSSVSLSFPFLLVVYFSFNFMHQLNYPLKKVKLNIKQNRGQTLDCVSREQRRAESTARETARKWCNRNRAPGSLSVNQTMLLNPSPLSLVLLSICRACLGSPPDTPSHCGSLLNLPRVDMCPGC